MVKIIVFKVCITSMARIKNSLGMNSTFDLSPHAVLTFDSILGEPSVNMNHRNHHRAKAMILIQEDVTRCTTGAVTNSLREFHIYYLNLSILDIGIHLLNTALRNFHGSSKLALNGI